MKVIIGLLIAISCYGQNTGQNVVYQVVSPNPCPAAPASCTITITNPGTTTYASSPVQNIGQTNHTGIFNVTAATAITNVFAYAVIQGSVNGITWENIGPSTGINVDTPTSKIQQYPFIGYGAYPYIRTLVTVDFSAGTSVTFNITYTGTSIPSNSLVDMNANTAQMTNLITGSLVTGGVKTGLITPQVNTQIVAVYGLEVYSDAVTGNSVTFSCTSIAGTGDWQIYNTGVTRTIIYPLGFRPYMTCGIGDTLYYTVNGAGTPAIELAVHYRTE